MLKFRRGRTAFCLFILACFATLFGVVHLSTADNSSSWLTSDLYLNKVGEVAAADVPASLFGGGNTDCTTIYAQKCSIDTPYGSVWNSSTWLDGKWRSIKDFGGNSSNFYAIPGSDTAFTTSSPSGFGSYVYFTDNISGSLSPNYLIGTPQLGGVLDYFQLNRPFDRKLADKTGARLAADLNSMAISSNSRWMVVTSPNIANLRVNLNTGEVLPFGRAFTYGFGQNPLPKNAITSDGRYSLETARNASGFSIYDLSTCSATPNSISGPASCQSRELLNSGYLSEQIPGFSGILYARFISDSTLMFYASYTVGTSTKYGQYTLRTEPYSTSQQQYLALGDSYISGEGTFAYIAGTDTNTNKCHLSQLSYPYLIGHDLSFDSYHSVACSGATIDDIINSSDIYDGQTTYKLTKEELQNTPQFGNILNSFSPGWIYQLEYVRKYQPQSITVSIGGNDMGFSKILEQCVAPWDSKTCYSTYEDRLELIQSINDNVFPNLVKTYGGLKRAGPADMRIYVIGYPQIALPGGDCAVNVRLNNDELTFAQQLISYLDGVIKDAADKAGVKYVDTQDALYGHRLCEAVPDAIAMNGLTIGDDRPSILGGPIADESYHPNKIGYRLLEEKILGETHNLSDLMPAANPAISPPEILSDLDILKDVPCSGRTVNKIQYDPSITTDFAYRGTPINININGAAHSLVSGTTLKAELHSDPIELGTFQTNSNRNLVTQITIPLGVDAGYHILHFYGLDVANQQVDIYKSIYVAATTDDVDGNGVPDSEQDCVGIPASGQDYDKDGIDDACDGNIGLPPVGTNQPKVEQASLVTSSPVKDSSSDSKSTNSVISDPQNHTNMEVITIAASSSNETKPSVLAAETKVPKTANASIGNKNNLGSYLIGVAGLFISFALFYAAMRWMS